ncbi:MAG: gliding motility protein RemB, partial [Cytophagaceae bacterium]|nr:gliding motility protein RemB [Cytophagaceae bacterium]
MTISDFEKYPVFETCESVAIAQLPNCFNQTLITFIIDRFEMPARVNDEKYQGEMVVLFEVTAEGQFKVLHTEAVYQELKDEMKSVFGQLPKVRPATYNASPTFMQFTMPVKIPLSRNVIQEYTNTTTTATNETKSNGTTNVQPNSMQQEYDRIQNQEFAVQNKFNSALNIPFSHQIYSRFDAALNQVGTNAHTSSKPFLYT